MDINILSTWGFIFFLLIILVWYLFVEVLFWEKYFFRWILIKYNNNFIDRAFHYILWWIILNILFIYLNSFWDHLNNLWEMFNSAVKFATILKPIVWSENSVKFILFSVSYFISIASLIFFIKILIKASGKLWVFTWVIADKIILLEKNKKKKLKK